MTTDYLGWSSFARFSQKAACGGNCVPCAGNMLANVCSVNDKPSRVGSRSVPTRAGQGTRRSGRRRYPDCRPHRILNRVDDLPKLAPGRKFRFQNNKSEAGRLSGLRRGGFGHVQHSLSNQSVRTPSPGESDSGRESTLRPVRIPSLALMKGIPCTNMDFPDSSSKF